MSVTLTAKQIADEREKAAIKKKYAEGKKLTAAEEIKRVQPLWKTYGLGRPWLSVKERQEYRDALPPA